MIKCDHKHLFIYTTCCKSPNYRREEIFTKKHEVKHEFYIKKIKKQFITRTIHKLKSITHE